MQTNLLEEIISDIVGRQGAEILKLLIGKKDVNEFLMAKKLKLTINQVRNILYKLSNHSLVTFTRKKDKRKGWYTYFWTLDNEKALELLEKKRTREIGSLENQLKSRKTKMFYTCKTCKMEISEETALLHNFECQECGEVYELADNKKIINDLSNSIAKLEKQKEDVIVELNKIKQEKEKKRARQIKRVESKKKAARKKARKKTKKKKLEKKSKQKKKKPKKKPKKKKKKKKPKKKKITFTKGSQRRRVKNLPQKPVKKPKKKPKKKKKKK